MSTWQVLSNVLYIFTPLSGEETEVGEVKLRIPAGKRQGWGLKSGVSDSHCGVSVNEATGCCCFLVSEQLLLRGISLGLRQSLPAAVLLSGPWQGCQAQPQSSLSWAVSDCSYSASLCPGITLGVWISYFFITDYPQTAQKWAVLLMLAGLARVSVVSRQVTWGLEGLGRPHACVQRWDVCLLERKRESGSCVSPHPAGYSGLFMGRWAKGSTVLRTQACKDSWEMLQSWRTVTSAASTGPKTVTGHPRFEKWGVEERSRKATLRGAWTRGGEWRPGHLCSLPHLLLLRALERGRLSLHMPGPLRGGMDAGFSHRAHFCPLSSPASSHRSASLTLLRVVAASHYLHDSSVIASLRSLLQLPYLKVSLSIFLLHHPPLFLSWHLSPCRIIRVAPSSI